MVAAVERPMPGDNITPVITALLNLGGSKGSTSSTTTATTTGNPAGVAGLQQILDQQIKSATPEGMQSLLQAIFQQGLEQVPGLATAYGQAAGARTGNNSPLQLAMQDMMVKLARESALQLRGNQQAASETANRLADSSKTVNQTASTSETKQPKASPMQLLPFLLANMGKLKQLPIIGDAFKGVGDALGIPSTSQSPITGGIGNTPGVGSAANPFDMNTLAGGMGGDISSSLFNTADGFTTDNTGGIFDPTGGVGSATSGFDDVSNILPDTSDFAGDAIFEFSKGGLVQGTNYKKSDMKAKGYADGGLVKGITSADNRDNIKDAQGNEIRGVTYNGADLNQQFDLLRAVTGVGSDPSVNRKEKEATAAPVSTTPMLKKQPDGTYSSAEDAGPSGVGEGIATGQVGTVDQNNAAINGAAVAAISAGLGIPGIAITAVMNALGIPTTPFSPMTGVVNLGKQVINNANDPSNGVASGLSPESVAAATGTPGVNSGGLAGLGISLGLADDGSATGATPASADAAGSGIGEGIGVGGAGDAAFSRGGKVKGKTGKDKVPAMLTNNEFVVNAPAVAKIGAPLLQMMNDNPDAFMQAIQSAIGGGASTGVPNGR